MGVAAILNKTQSSRIIFCVYTIMAVGINIISNNTQVNMLDLLKRVGRCVMYMYILIYGT